MGNATKILRWLVKETPGKMKRLILGQGGRFEKLLPEVASRQHLYDRKNKKIISLNVRDEVDASVINQIFTNEDYGISRLKRSAEISAIYNRAIESGKKPLIIDCGGNSGMATRYFKETYPNAHIVCIEPDQNNIHAAKGNNPDSATIKFLAAGVGSERTRANIQDPGQGNWAYRVEASR